MEGYKIEHKGLKSGQHNISFEVGMGLFETFGYSEVKGCSCRADISLSILEATLKAEISISGDVVVECDRCLEPCQIPIEYRAPLLVKICDHLEDWQLEESQIGEVIWISSSDDTLDLTQYIYESILLSLPYQRVHPQGECNPEMTERFNIVSQEQFDDIEQKKSIGNIGQEELSKLEALKAKMKTLTTK